MDGRERVSSSKGASELFTRSHSLSYIYVPARNPRCSANIASTQACEHWFYYLLTSFSELAPNVVEDCALHV